MKIGIIVIIIFVVVMLGALMIDKYTDKNIMNKPDSLALSTKIDRMSYFTGSDNGNNFLQSTMIRNNTYEWNFEVVFQDELNATIEFLEKNSTGVYFIAWVDSYNDSRTNQGGYKFKIHTNATYDNGTIESKTWRVNLNKNDLKKWYYFDFPPNLISFRAEMGESSTLIDGTSSTTATYGPALQHICFTPNGRMHVGYWGASADPAHAFSDNNGTTWNTTENIIADTIATGVGIICHDDNNISLFWLNGGNVWYVNTTAFYSGNASYTYNPTRSAAADHAFNTYSHFSVCRGQKDVVEMCIVDNGGRMDYVNSTIYDNEISIHSDTSNDTDSCDCVVNSLNVTFIFGSGTDKDTIDVWNKTKGFGTDNRTTIVTGSGYTDSADGPVAYIDENDKFLVTAHLGTSVLYICNFTTPSDAYCFDNANNQRYHPQAIITKRNDCIVASSSATDFTPVSVGFSMGNATLGDNCSTWQNADDVPLESGDKANYPGFIHQIWPDINRPVNKVFYVWTTALSDLWVSSLDVTAPPIPVTEFAPNITSINLNSTSGRNKTTENLTVYLTFSDANNDNVSGAINWIKNNKELVILNLPMDLASDLTTTHDFSNYQNHGTVSAATIKQGKIGTAFNFTAGNIDVPDHPSVDLNSNMNFTIEGWVYPYVVYDLDDILTKRTIATSGGYEFYLSSNSIAFIVEATNGTSTIISYRISNNSWTYFVGGYNNQTGNISLFINGTLVNTTYLGHDIGVNSNTLRLGNTLEASPDVDLQGMLDDLIFWNITLSEKQISAFYYNYSHQILSENMTEHLENWTCTVVPVDQKGLNGSSQSCNTIRVIDQCICPNTYGRTYWDLQGSDYCTLTSDCNILNSTFRCSGTGWFKHNGGSIVNFSDALYDQGCDLDCTLGNGCFNIA